VRLTAGRRSVDRTSSLGRSLAVSRRPTPTMPIEDSADSRSRLSGGFEQRNRLRIVGESHSPPGNA
jgi:hypothetical protein